MSKEYLFIVSVNICLRKEDTDGNSFTWVGKESQFAVLEYVHDERGSVPLLRIALYNIYSRIRSEWTSGIHIHGVGIFDGTTTW